MASPVSGSSSYNEGDEQTEERKEGVGENMRPVGPTTPLHHEFSLSYPQETRRGLRPAGRRGETTMKAEQGTYDEVHLLDKSELPLETTAEMAVICAILEVHELPASRPRFLGEEGCLQAVSEYIGYAQR